jgi:hypothetical protein
MLVRKANADEEQTKWAVSLYHQHDQSIPVTDDVTVASLPASLPQKISAFMDHLRQIALNRNLSRKFEKWCKFLSRIKAKSCKMKSCKIRPACTLFPKVFHIGLYTL